MTRAGLLIVLLAVAALSVSADGPPAFSQGAGENTSSGDVELGERVFQSSCAMCHGQDAAGMMGMHPSLRGAVARLSREGVEVTIRQGRQTQPPMPAFGDRLAAQEIDDVVAYIASLPEGPRNFGPDGDSGMMGDGMGMDGRDLMPIVVGVGLAALGVFAGAAIARNRGSPRHLLARRYATGQLTRDEYLQARRDIDGEPR